MPFPAGALRAFAAAHDADPQGKWLMAAVAVDDLTPKARRVFVDSARWDAVVGDFVRGTSVAGAAPHMSDLAHQPGPVMMRADTLQAEVSGSRLAPAEWSASTYLSDQGFPRTHDLVVDRDGPAPAACPLPRRVLPGRRDAARQRRLHRRPADSRSCAGAATASYTARARCTPSPSRDPLAYLRRRRCPPPTVVGRQGRRDRRQQPRRGRAGHGRRGALPRSCRQRCSTCPGPCAVRSAASPIATAGGGGPRRHAAGGPRPAAERRRRHAPDLRRRRPRVRPSPPRPGPTGSPSWSRSASASSRSPTCWPGSAARWGVAVPRWPACAAPASRPRAVRRAYLVEAVLLAGVVLVGRGIAAVAATRALLTPIHLVGGWAAGPVVDIGVRPWILVPVLWRSRCVTAVACAVGVHPVRPRRPAGRAPGGRA